VLLVNRLSRAPKRAAVGAAALTGLPLLVAVIALRSQHWYPVLDLAMTELRVRDVFGPHTPLIGLPGRIGEEPNRGSHPGPLSFYLLAPTYRLLGSSPWALEAGAVVIHLAAIAVAVWIGYRRAGWRGSVAVAALLAIVMRGYGQLLLTQPWNPYQPLLAWMVVLLAAWAVLCGDYWMAVPMVVAGSLCAQTHVPYLVPAGAITIAALVYVATRDRRPALVAAAVGIVLWLPPVIDQLVHRPGNLRVLIDHFTSPNDPPIGTAAGVKLALAHLDPWTALVRQLAGTGTFLDGASAWRGAVTLLIWAVAAAVAWRVGSGPLRRLHVVVAAALVLGAASMVRIFGLAWYYLTLWAWGVAVLAAGAIVWSALAAWRAWRPAAAGRAGRVAVTAAAVVAAVASLASAVAFADAEVPERRLSDAVAALADPTYDAVADGVGAASGTGAQYLVRWSDAADIGSPGYGLFVALERRGLDVRGDEFFRATLTPHRVAPRTPDGVQIHLATGGYVDIWRGYPDAVEVATYEPRSGDELERYGAVRRQLLDRLAGEGLDDVASIVDTNLFGASLDPRLSGADRADFTELLDLGQPMAVFIAPATTGY